jgi:hypothetical protein
MFVYKFPALILSGGLGVVFDVKCEVCRYLSIYWRQMTPQALWVVTEVKLVRSNAIIPFGRIENTIIYATLQI